MFNMFLTVLPANYGVTRLPLVLEIFQYSSGQGQAKALYLIRNSAPKWNLDYLKGRMMPKKYRNVRIYKRERNGACVMDRQCTECRKAFIGERNLCPTCRNRRRRYQYHRRNGYFIRLRSRNDLSRKPELAGPRKAAWTRQKQRIQAEIQAIRKAGLDPDSDSVKSIQQDGIIP